MKDKNKKETQMKQTKRIKHQQKKNQTSKHENNLGLKRGCQGNVFKGKKPKLTKGRATQKKLKQNKQNKNVLSKAAEKHGISNENEDKNKKK